MIQCSLIKLYGIVEARMPGPVIWAFQAENSPVLWRYELNYPFNYRMPLFTRGKLVDFPSFYNLRKLRYVCAMTFARLIRNMHLWITVSFFPLSKMILYIFFQVPKDKPGTRKPWAIDIDWYCFPKDQTIRWLLQPLADCKHSCKKKLAL